MLRGPLGLKYSCPSQSTWLLCHSTLLSVIEEGVDTACDRGLHIPYKIHRFKKRVEVIIYNFLLLTNELSLSCSFGTQNKKF